MTDVAQSGVGVVTPLHDGCCSVTHSQTSQFTVTQHTAHTAHTAHSTQQSESECRASPHVCPVRFQPVVPRKNEIVLYISSSTSALCSVHSSQSAHAEILRTENFPQMLRLSIVASPSQVESIGQYQGQQGKHLEAALK